MGQAWDLFFGSVFGEMPIRMRMALVQEFFVSRERIRLRPRSFYLQALQWQRETMAAQQWTSWELTNVFEMMW